MRRSKRTRTRRPADYYEAAGLDLAAEMSRLCALPVFGGGEGPLTKDPPSLSVRRASARPLRNLGFAVPSERRISVTAYPDIRPGDLQEVLLHELVHIAVGRRGRSWHGQLFKRTLREAMRQAYGVAVGATQSTTHGAYADALERRRLSRSGPRRLEVHPDQLAFDAAA